MEGQNPCLLDLPNEILILVLASYQTQPLLRLREVSHRFQNLVLRIVHGRLLLAASLEDRKLILECHHPSARWMETYLYCDYLGTPGLSKEREGHGPIFDHANESGGGKLREVYSRFKPTLNVPEPRFYRRHPAGDIPGSRTSEAASSRQTQETGSVRRTINLDAHENFSQLIFSAQLVQLGPRRGLLMSAVDVVEAQKPFRLFRPWLAEMAQTSKRLVTQGSQEARPEPVWIDERKKNAGMYVKVHEKRWRREMPLLLDSDEDQAVSYSLELEELLISTTHLLLAFERSLIETENDTGKAMIFGSFATQNDQQADDTATA